MDCCEFREKYSDFADGLLDDEAELHARRHLSLCASCRHFDSAFRTGIGALRNLPSVEVSRGFRDGLRRRIGHELIVRGLAVDPLWGAIAALLVIVTVGFVSWDLSEPRGARHAAPAVATSVPPRRFRVPAAPRIRFDAVQMFGGGFHPFDPVLLVADTSPAPDAYPPRFDVPAIWGAR